MPQFIYVCCFALGPTFGSLEEFGGMSVYYHSIKLSIFLLDQTIMFLRMDISFLD